MRQIAAALVVIAIASTLGCSSDAPPDPDTEPPTVSSTEEPLDHAAEVEAWRSRRLEGLTKPEGWLSLVGLYWLDEGPNTLGSDPSSQVVLPEGKGPAQAGIFHLEGGKVRIEAPLEAGITHDGKPVEELILASDTDDEGPTTLELGDLVFYVIDRAGKLGIRIKDPESSARKAFEGIPIYPVDESWRIETRFEEYDPVKHIPVPNIIGTVFDETSWGALVFEREGVTHRLDVIAEPGAKRLFVVFADETTGTETYGGGRYVYTDGPDENGRVILDFNMAYNPPCVFTAFATCPLPPKGNRLAFRVEAGEKKYEGPISH